MAQSVALLDRIDVHSIPGFEEPVSCLTHLLGAGVFAVLGAMLLRRGRGSSGRMLALAVLGVASVFLLSMSGMYHMLSNGSTARAVMKRLDVAAVFVLIAGTFTPIHAILCRGIARWGALLLIWSVVAAGITLRTIFFDSAPRWVGTPVFLLLGWVGVFEVITLRRRYSFRFVEPLVWGGVAYSIGAIVLMFHWPTLIPGVIGPHEIWHFAVLTGLAFHWSFIWQFATGDVPQAALASLPATSEAVASSSCEMS